MATHKLKKDPAVFQATIDGIKDYEIRFNDRNFQVGDELHIRETASTGEEMEAGAPLEYTGRMFVRKINGILTGYGLKDGWCILNVSKV